MTSEDRGKRNHGGKKVTVCLMVFKKGKVPKEK
jgi:hypothetical protein